MRQLWRPSAVVLALLACLTFLLWFSRNPDRQLNVRMQQELQKFRLHDAELTRDVLLDRAGLLPNLDTLMYDRQQLQQSVEILRAISDSGTGDARAALTPHIADLSTAVQERLVPVERFKSANALLRKSLMYLTFLAPELRVSLQDQRIAAQMSRLAYAVLRYLQLPDTNTEAEIQAVLDQLRRYSAPHSELRTLVAHGELIKLTLPQVDKLMRTIVKVNAPTTQNANMLQAAVSQYSSGVDLRAHIALNLTYFVALMLLAYLLYQASRLLSSDLRFRAITESTREAIVSVDTRGRVHSWNAGAVAMFGYSIQEIVGQDAMRLLTPEHHALFREKLARFVDGAGTPASASAQEFTALHATGREFPSEISLSTWSTFQGRFATAIVRDVSEKKALETRARQQELRLLQADRMSTLGTLVASVAHDIKGPTQVVQQNSQILARAWADALPALAHQREMQPDFRLAGVSFDRMRESVPVLIGDLGDSAQEIRSFIGDMLEFARPARAEDPQSFQINETVQRAVRLLRGSIRERTNRFSMSLAEGLPPARGNTQLFSHVVVNLLSNALRSLPDQESAVRVDTSFDAYAGCLVLVVADEGAGMDAAILRVAGVEPLPADRPGGGSGLGLALIAELLRAQDGRLEFEPGHSRGTRAVVRIPVATAADSGART